MRRRITVGAIVVSVAVTTSTAHAQSEATGPAHALSGASVVEAPEAVPGVARRIAPTQVDLASAALNGKEKGTEFRMTITPGRLFDTKYYPVLSESKFTILTDSGKSLTQVAYGLSYNPFALSGSRAERIMKENFESARCGKAKREAETGSKTKVKAARAKVEALEAERTKAFEAWQDALTSSPPNATAAAELVAKVRQLDKDIATAKADLETDEDAVSAVGADAAKAFKECNATLFVRDWEKINKAWVPQISANVALDIYPSGEGPDPDPAKAAQSAPLEPFGGVRTDAGLSFRPHERFSFQLWGNYWRVRATGGARTELASYYGGGLTISWIAVPLLSEKTKSTEYLETGFIPGIAVGASGQGMRCDGGQQCDKGRTRLMSLTPFIDIKVKAALQFRIAVPITRFSAVSTKDGTDVAPTFTLATAISGL